MHSQGVCVPPLQGLVVLAQFREYLQIYPFEFQAPATPEVYIAVPELGKTAPPAATAGRNRGGRLASL